MTEECSFLLCKPFTSTRIVFWFTTENNFATVSYYLFHLESELTNEIINNNTDRIKVIEV